MRMSDEERKRRNAERNIRNYHKNKDVISKKQAEYYQNNKETIKKRSLDRYYEDPQKVIDSKRKWREKNRERDNATNREWKKRNPDSVQSSGRNRRAAKRNADGKHFKGDIAALKEKQGGLCPICGAVLSETGYHVDHIVPIVKGGSNWPSNLQLLCPPCNLRKHTKDNEEFIKTRRKELGMED